MKTQSTNETIALLAFPERVITAERKIDHSEVSRKVHHIKGISVEPSKTVKFKRLNFDTRENLTDKQCIIRLCALILLPALSAMDWFLGTYYLFLVAPVVLYLTITAFISYCPGKALFSSSERNSLYE